MLLHSWRHECYAFASESPASKMVFEVCHKKERKRSRDDVGRVSSGFSSFRKDIRIISFSIFYLEKGWRNFFT